MKYIHFSFYLFTVTHLSKKTSLIHVNRRVERSVLIRREERWKIIPDQEPFYLFIRQRDEIRQIIEE
ncbi:MAG: hypothetical protein AMK70_14810 [Nitrospira bacterium SG8_35_1]|nr:MAG: hypothetical protein AMK70_14810 [Nitrospira bacterium SG8_35_1]